MGHTLLSLLGFFLLNLLYRGQAQDAVLTIEPNRTTFFIGESVTFKCDITGDKDSDWSYSIHWNGGGFLSYHKHESFKLPSATGYSGEYQCFFHQNGSTKESNTIYLTVSDRIVILESPASTLFEGESVTLRCRHRTQREENVAFYRDGSLITTDRNHQSPIMAKHTVQVMSDGSSYSCKFGDEESEPIKLRTEPTPKAQLRDIFPGGGNVTLTCSVGPSSASGWRYFWYKKENTSEPLKTQDVFLTNDRISVSRGGVYWCRGGRGNPVYYTEYSDAVVTNRAVVTLRPNWPEIYSGETITLTCEIKDGGDSEWDYIWMTPGSETPLTSEPKYTLTSQSGDYGCMGRLKGDMSSTQWSDVLTLKVSDNTPEPVLTVSPSWPSPGASVTLNCRVDHLSAGWSFYWYKAVPQKSGYSYSYELLPGSHTGTEQHLFIIDGQTHTAGYVCRAGRGDPVFYSGQSEPKFIWSGDLNSAASLTVSPDSVQHFTKTPVSLSCEGNSTEWRVMMLSESDKLYRCSSLGTMTGSTCTITRYWLSGVYWCDSETGQFSNAVNITVRSLYGEIILLSPVRPVAEGRSVTLSCKLKTQTVYNVDFYKNDKLIQNDTRRELTISAVSKSDEGFYKCKQRDSADGWTSPESWFSVKSSMHGEASEFPILLIVGLLCGVLLIILLLLFLYLYRKSKDSCYSRSQRTNQGPATDHMINQDETNQREYASVLQDNACLYETIKGPEEPANDESTDVTYSVLELKNISKKGKKNEPEDCVYSHVQMASAAGKSSPAPADETVYSELKPGTGLGKNAAVKVDVCVRDRESVFDVKMGHTLLCALGLFLLNTRLQCCDAEDALTLKTNWSTLYTGETVTLACDKSDGQDTDWSYTFTRNNSKLDFCKTKKSSCSFKLTKNDNGQYQCSVFQTKTNSTNQSNIVRLTVLDNPKPALNVSRSWLSPGASVTLNCSVTDSAAGWRFYWYKAVANLSINSNYSFELLPGKSNGTENNTYVVNGQIHTAGYVCRAGRGNPVHYSWYSKPKFVWSGDSHAPSVKVSPDRVQHFSSDPVSLSCEGNQSRVVRFTEAGHLSNCSDWGRKNGSTWIIKNLTNKTAVYWCEFASGEFSNAVNITIGLQSDVILVSPVHPVTEGDSVRLSCKVKSGSLSFNVSFFRNNTLQNYTSAELRISAVSKSDEGFYMCRYAEKKSAQSWLSVKSASSPGKMNRSSILLLIIGLVCGIVVFIFLLLFCCCMKSKDSSFARTTLFQRTNQGFAPDQLVNLNEIQPQHPSSHLHDESGDVTYSSIHLKDIRKTENSSAAEETVYSEVKLDKAPGNNVTCIFFI
ncbi:LOW QUALITY PROTEIN: uncharacterized protein LOC117498005 [Trematomus bernacchii]|uniref:LOW QUALITY PROTEIN: uncharacterized protein LOC117498005 n=1 Tax=Trematomus bernacchii TaxID=40690 RepID=UPI00146DE3E1|nr:LOW QUALITY PROTEIN: uncharacterized protein LOC117498005 [Trematomus bernacchii]